MNRQTMKIEEAAKILGLGRSAAYAAAKHGEIPTIRIGKLILVPKVGLEKMLAEAGKKGEIER